MNYKVTISNGRYFAPSLSIEASNELEAERKAKELSGLARFKTWTFSAVINRKHKQIICK